jgi:hypothetical protein
MFYDATTFEVVSRIRDTAATKHLLHSPLCMTAFTIPDGKYEVLAVGDDGGNVTVSSLPFSSPLLFYLIFDCACFCCFCCSCSCSSIEWRVPDGTFATAQAAASRVATLTI